MFFALVRGRAPRGMLALRVACAALLLPAACHDPVDTGRTQGAWLEGRVTNATGAPVAGVPVALAYRTVEYGWDIGCYPYAAVHEPRIAVSANIAFDLPNPGTVDLRVFDFARRPVRTLVDGQLPAGQHRVVWNGTDDAGRPVPTGAYFYVLHVIQPAEEWRVEKKLLVARCREDNLVAPHSVTDGDGLYRIEMALLPVNETFEIVLDEAGSPVVIVTISDLVQVQAGVSAGATLRWAEADVRVTDRAHDVHADLVLP